MPDEIEKIKKQLADAQKILKDPSRRGYYALNKILYQVIEYLENFNLKSTIGGNPKEDKEYDRAKGLWEGLKAMIMDCRTLKQELNIPFDEEDREIKKIYGTTPESIADAVGELAGKTS